MPNRHTRAILAAAAIFVAGGVTTLLVVQLASLNRFDLSPWHTLRMGAEQRACVASDIASFQAYQVCEKALIAEADRRLADRVDQWPTLSRFSPESPTWARQFSPDWNHTVELPAEQPVGGALLLHGLSDSPYSLHDLATRLNAQGFHVVVPRLPGHGLFPGALIDARWQHWRRVVRLAATHLREKVGPEAPVLMVGYSNGAALVMDHTLAALEEGDADIVMPDRLVFLSPAMAVTRFARIGAAVDVLGRVPGLASVAWNSVVPEFDPVKYNSFPVRAGYEIEQLLDHVEKRLERLHRDGRLEGLPPVLTIQSAVDDTVPPVASLQRLYDRVHDERSQLVLFDTNHETRVEGFLNDASDRLIALVGPETVFDFDVTLVTNRRRPSGEKSPVTEDVTAEVYALTRHAGTTRVSREPLGMSWPENIYSLSHVAIPFAPDDPVYGEGTRGGLGIGGLAVKGERGVLKIPASLLARLRYNPFHDYLDRRIDAFVRPLVDGISESPETGAVNEPRAALIRAPVPSYRVHANR